MSTARTTSHPTTLTDLPSWAQQVEDLEAMLATDDDTVDTAVIPRLAYREAVEDAAVTAIRRNLIALATVLVTTVVLGAGVTWIGGWIALVGYALLVLGFSVALRQANSRYAPRHSRYTPRRA